MINVGLLSLATALPPYSVEQHLAKAKARELFGGRKELFDRLAGVFDNAAIARRHIVAPIEWYEGHHGWKERNRVYLDACDAMFRDAASKAIDRSGLKPSEIDGVVMVSTTGIATPSIEARNGPAIGLRDDVRRVPVFGMGCAGGINGLATAARLAAAEPGTNWLFVTIETCSIAIRLDSDEPAAIVATAIFGDGAAAAVVGSGHSRLATIAGAGEKMWPDTLNIMGWRVEDPGLAVVFDRAIPPFVEAELAKAVDGILSGFGRSRTDIDRFCCHPGGVKVIDAIESALELPVGTLDLEREVLGDCGNMSAPTVLFVLDRLIARGLPERVLMTAFGPGFTAAGMLLELR
ncbi:type III polyketide synthase [Sphingomonas sp. RB56-2]|uniref:Type III polyketide synthase n=1 Tax=Sphingomonas brevis TaxID=2908206 RepID=A0ABT0S945_9SPHN|nr:3-oxoacyl-[acyl-carrier-protein] synthase III C-terminal domain-containing protein [Sphingomonas brevis]MCL6740926.1 type III polyketide synthase [Sphingomonas brevis]